MDKVIIAQDLSLSYSNNETIINKANFSISPGSFVLLQVLAEVENQHF